MSFISFSLDDMAMPWPLRVFESEREGVVVELVMTGSVDPELGMYFGEDPLWTNQSAVLHWYCGSSHCQLNLRSIIRRERKKVCGQLLFLALVTSGLTVVNLFHLH